MFTDMERLIFTADVMGARRRYDPLAVRRALLRESGGQFHRWWTEAAAAPAAVPPEPAAAREATGDPADPATQASIGHARLVGELLRSLDSDERAVRCLRAAFGLPEYDPESGAGVPESVCWDVLRQYDEFQEKNAHWAGNSRTGSPADSLPATAG